MKRRALLPLVTCPDPISDGAAANAAAMAARLDADLHALAVIEDIPPLSNALSRILLNTPELIRQSETMSRKRGKEMLAAVTGQAGLIGVEVTTTTLAAAPALLGDAAATQARCFDFALVEWAANNQTSRMTAEAAILSLGRPTILVPERSEPDATDHVAIAWDGSCVAARAVADAGRWLQRAARIFVLTVVAKRTGSMLPLNYPEQTSLPVPMPTPQDVRIFRVTPTVVSVLDYFKGFGHTDLVTC